MDLSYIYMFILCSSCNQKMTLNHFIQRIYSTSWDEDNAIIEYSIIDDRYINGFPVLLPFSLKI
uniref:Uncharacterized protein n=1 Tax=Lepeophtheirus salmonis TaxID=72036 RepID=A0A0K2UKF8_LEPSM